MWGSFHRVQWFAPAEILAPYGISGPGLHPPNSTILQETGNRASSTITPKGTQKLHTILNYPKYLDFIHVEQG